MNGQPHEPEIDTNAVNPNAVSLYGQTDAMDDFPVLKAFQQYIDSEQAKARKRLISLGIFFGVLMGAVIAVFLVMLFNITERNQSLNDRLIEFAMKERERPQQQPVVVQPPVQQDNSAILSLTSKIEEMQNKLIESQKKAEAAERAQKAAAEAAAAALAPKAPSQQELEIERLKTLLNAEKEKAAAEKAKQREAELEAYRRKHYPECYAQPKPVATPAKPKPRRPVIIEDDDEDEVEPIRINPRKILDGKAIRYFDDEDEDEDVDLPKAQSAAKKTDTPPSPKSETKPEPKVPAERATEPTKPTAAPAKTAEQKTETKPYTIPVEVKGKTSNWFLP